MKKPVQFGKYYLLERVNVGGMAEVFKAKTVGVEGFERFLAVKRILPNIAEDKDFITMFIDEAKIAGQLSHANICQIFDLGKADDAYFIALEYVSGKDLRVLFDRAKQKLDGGPGTIPIAQSCFVVMKVCEGLDYAHNKRDASGHELHLVHRDVSPQNVLISYEGEVKLIDFGIAKAAGKASKTQAGILKGKFGYMSPEQVRGLPLDRRSDIFAVGIVLYEMLTGERLFYGDSDFSILEKVRNVEILPPTAYNRKVPEELERIVLKALAKDVEDRYQNAIDLHDDLQAFMYTSGDFYSRKELAAYMKRTFTAEIAAEDAHDEEYRSIGAMIARGDSGVVKAPEPQAGRKTVPPGAKAPPPTPSAAPRAPSGNGAAVSASAGKVPAGVKKAPSEGLLTIAPAEPTSDLSWDDDELETHVYEAAHDATDAVLEEEDVDEGSLPSLDEIELGGSGAPVLAKGPAWPDMQKMAMAATEMGPSPVVKSDKPDARTEGKNGRATANLAAASAPLAAATPAKTVSLSAPVARSSSNPAATTPPLASASIAPTPAARNIDELRTPSRSPILSAPVGSSTVKVATPLAAPSWSPARRDATPSLANGSGPYGEAPASLLTAAVTRAPADDKRTTKYVAVALAGAAVLGLALYLALRPTTGEIALQIEPADGVQISVDGHPVSAKEAAHLVRGPGVHPVAVEHDGYRAWNGEVKVTVGASVAQRIVLEPLPRAGFTLVSEPAGATATLDGTALAGVTPFKVESLAPGHHTLEVTATGYSAWSKPLDLEPGSMLEVQAALVAVAPPTPPPAAVLPRLPAPPPPNLPREDTPPVEAPPSTGPTAHVEREHPAGNRRHLPTPPPERHAEVEPSHVETPPPPPPPRSSGGEGFMRIGSKPWTKISVDGRDTGLVTPQTSIKLPAGTHRVTLTNPQFGIAESFSVDIKPGTTETVVKDLRPKDE